MQTRTTSSFSLIVTAGARHCALPLESVLETMRVLKAERIPGAPAFVLGVSIIRGEAVPVVDLAALLGEPASAQTTRLVLLRIDDHRVALVVDTVLDVHEHDPDALLGMPSLAGEITSGAAVAIERLDDRFLLVLDTAKLISTDTLEILGRLDVP